MILRGNLYNILDMNSFNVVRPKTDTDGKQETEY